MAQQFRVGTTATTVRANEAGRIVVTYHGTPVVAFDDKTITLDTGGWRSATTRTRMNQAAAQFGLGYTVRQKDFDWYIITEAGAFDFIDTAIIDRETGEVLA